MELNIEKFSPKKAELELVANKYKNLSIEDINDVTGYKLVDEARKDLKRKRVEIEKTGKELRDEANKFAKGVIALQNELVGIISPIEEELKEKQAKIDKEKERQARLVVLPERKEKLESVRVIGELIMFPMLTDDEILDMDSDVFQSFYNQKKEEYLNEKENQLEIERQKQEAEKKRQEDEKKRLDDLEKARQEAKKQAEKEAKDRELRLKQESKDREERLKREAKEAKDKAIADERRKADLAKQKLIDEQKRKEEEETKRKADEKARVEKEAKEINYKNWLKDNGVINQEDLNSNYRVIREDGKVILCKILSIYNNK